MPVTDQINPELVKSMMARRAAMGGGAPTRPPVPLSPPGGAPAPAVGATGGGPAEIRQALTVVVQMLAKIIAMLPAPAQAPPGGPQGGMPAAGPVPTPMRPPMPGGPS